MGKVLHIYGKNEGVAPLRELLYTNIYYRVCLKMICSKMIMVICHAKKHTLDGELPQWFTLFDWSFMIKASSLTVYKAVLTGRLFGLPPVFLHHLHISKYHHQPWYAFLITINSVHHWPVLYNVHCTPPTLRVFWRPPPSFLTSRGSSRFLGHPPDSHSFNSQNIKSS